VTTVQDLEVTVTSHIDVCAVRYEAIHARLKRLENLLMRVGGAIIVILLTAFGTVTMMWLESIIAWLLGQVTSFSTRLTKIEGQMPALITPEGVPTDSPISAERRQRQKEELLDKIYDLQMRVKLLEQKETGK
jgi:hypothetical protein